jgi:FkbM family methyltransferase
MEFANLDRQRFSSFKALGFSPSCIYDIGASNGSWSWSMKEVFPDATYHLFEPLAEIHPPYAKGLAHVQQAGLRARVHATAVGASSGSTTFGVDKDVVGSSTLVHRTSEVFPRIITVPQTSIDEIVSREGLPVPQLIKIDIQGSELAALQGATETLRHVEILLLETWFVRGYGPETPLFMEIANWLAKHQFFLLDIGDSYRDPQGILVAPDFFFVRQPSSISAFNGRRDFTVGQP